MELDSFKTLNQSGEAEVVIKKSRFIGHAKPVTSEDEALEFIAKIRKDHSAATHNCFAYMVGERDQFQKQSDDGEPSGTAGKPILEVIKNQGLKNVAVVVTRYYGGIMLGAGGLIRAYTEGAVVGIEAAQLIYKKLHQEVSVEVDYTWHGKVENELRNRDVMIDDILFSDKVTLVCLPLAAEAEKFIENMVDFTQGQGKVTQGETRYIDHVI
ncbi:YigZ family protein [Chengkuizengella axinellae]|uniref:YigZ family protein n=1 Tax=Chengkuizengella axinellae TaxID=3064388 RepID=A0ABT9J3V8_9BACL|nr:YigZ family protein [Chengkuizengella sp. 2205SS18-9]MDP5276275.1 YigZ family protein [Chengkuizengella sp. 2205SS18-9]